MLGAADRVRREAERDLALAHMTAAMTRTKKLEPLERYLPRALATRPAKAGAMLGRLIALADATGGTVGGG